MNIFLTGATGFLGTNLTDYLLRNTDHSLVLLVHKKLPESLAEPGGRVRLVTGNLGDPLSYRDYLHGCQAVIHAAALVATWARDRRLFDRVNVDWTLEFLRSAGEAGAQRIIYISSFLALGPSEGKPLTEADPFQRNSFLNDYERTKYLANLGAMELASQGLPLTILYPAVIYGPGPLTSGNLVTSILLDYLRGRLYFRLGDGAPRWNYVFVGDIVRGVLLALEKGTGRDRYILGSENASLAEFFDTVEEVTGIRKPRLSLPYSLAYFAGAVEEGLALFTGRVPRTTRAVVDIFQKNWVYDSALARKTLGYEALSLKEGLVRTVEWLREKILSGKEKRRGG